MILWNTHAWLVPKYSSILLLLLSALHCNDNRFFGGDKIDFNRHISILPGANTITTNQERIFPSEQTIDESPVAAHDWHRMHFMPT